MPLPRPETTPPVTKYTLPSSSSVSPLCCAAAAVDGLFSKGGQPQGIPRLHDPVVKCDASKIVRRQFHTRRPFQTPRPRLTAGPVSALSGSKKETPTLQRRNSSETSASLNSAYYKSG